MFTIIKEISSYAQLSVPSRPAPRTRRPWKPRRLAVLPVLVVSLSAYMLQCTTALAEVATTFLTQQAIKYGTEKLPQFQEWASDKLSKPCHQCNPQGLAPGDELTKLLEEHPECKGCKKCRGDGIIHVTDRMPGYKAPSTKIIENCICPDCKGSGKAKSKLWPYQYNGPECKTCGQCKNCSFYCSDAAAVNECKSPESHNGEHEWVSNGILRAGKEQITDTLAELALRTACSTAKWGFNKFMENCPACNKTGSKDSEDPKVKACTYCGGDGLIHPLDRLSCANCECKTSGKPRKQCKEWHLKTLKHCPTTPCSDCAKKFGLIYRTSCPNCVCTTSEKYRRDCPEKHLETFGQCPTTPCLDCKMVLVGRGAEMRTCTGTGKPATVSEGHSQAYKSSGDRYKYTCPMCYNDKSPGARYCGLCRGIRAQKQKIQDSYKEDLKRYEAWKRKRAARIAKPEPQRSQRARRYLASALHRRRLTHGIRTPPVVAALMQQIEQAKRLVNSLS